MKTTSLKKLVLITLTTAGLTAGSLVPAQAANKSITCYKGSISKVVSAAKPKCPTGYTTTKPVASPTKVTGATPSKAGGVVAMNATYKGKISLLWSDSAVTVTGVTATGTGTTAGLEALSGNGSSSPSSQCDAINGAGVLGSGADTLKVSVDSTSKGCAADADAPTTVTLTGNALITGGTGKYAGASGLLKVTGTFAIKSTAAGFSESPALTLTISGNITTK